MQAPQARAPHAEPGERTTAPEGEVASFELSRRAVRWRKWRWPLTAAGVLVALAVIPYPLHVTEPCVLLPAQRRVVRAQIAGLLTTIEVGEGATVHAGQVIAQLDDRELKSQLARIQAQVGATQAELARLRHGARPEEIARAKSDVLGEEAALRFATEARERIAKLHQAQVASDGQLEAAERDRAVAEQKLAEAKASLALLLAGTRPEELEAKQAELDKARAEEAFVEDQLARLTIKSPIDGVITTPRLKEHQGEYLAPGAEVAEVVDLSRMRVEAQVDEREMDAVRAGEPMKLKVASFPEKAFWTHVEFVSPATVDKDGRRYVRVVGTVDNPERLLREDVGGYAEINAGNRSLLTLGTRRVLRWIRVRFLL